MHAIDKAVSINDVAVFSPLSSLAVVSCGPSARRTNSTLVVKTIGSDKWVVGGEPRSLLLRQKNLV